MGVGSTELTAGFNLRAALVLLLAVLAACNAGTSGEPSPQRSSDAGYIACASPRPEVCTYDYQPVCAQRDTGVRCIKQPCASSEPVTMSNGCSACSDAKVLGYRAGAC